MLNFLVFVMVTAWWTAVCLGIGGLFLMRLYAVLKAKLSWQKSLMALFIPFSIGYFLTFPEKSVFKRIYEALVILTFVLALLGGIFIYYTHFM